MNDVYGVWCMDLSYHMIYVVSCVCFDEFIISMQWCCPNRQADTLYKEEERQAMYVSQLESKKVKESQVQSFMHHSQGEYPQNTHGYSYNKQIQQNYLVSHPLFAPSKQIAQKRNHELSNSNEMRKIYLWKKNEELVERTNVLVDVYGKQNNQLRMLVSQIDRHFGERQ